MTSAKRDDEAGQTVLNGDSGDWIKPNLKGDWWNFFLLLFLYAIQGIPLGLTMAIPIILQSKKIVSYQEQALFSVVGLPFSLKIFWAPLVDAFYVRKIGRRKTWLIPVQILIGICFLYLARNIDELLPDTGKPDMLKLITVFFFTIFLAATQDIVVDGWALTMLKKNNVGYASICNTTGQTVGFMIGSVIFVLLTSKDFCNKYLRVAPDTGGIMTMKSLFNIWGILYIVITVLVAILKKEKKCGLEDSHVSLNIVQNYMLLRDILKLPTVQILAAVLLTKSIGFAATDSVSTLKLIDAGVSKDNIMMIHTAMFVVKSVIPLAIGKYTSGPKPLSIFLNMTPFRLIWNITFVMLIYYTPKMITVNGVVNIPLYYYAILIFILSIHDVLSNIMSVAIVSFFARVSDSRFGGTYMTLLNTLANLGNAWTSALAMAVVDILTFKECSLDSTNNCSALNRKNMCETNGGQCLTKVNGYYVESAVCTVIGIVWYGIIRSVLKNLQTKNLSHWLVNTN